MRQVTRNAALIAFGVGLFGIILKERCASFGWGGSAETYYALCYSDVHPLYQLRGFADNIVPYLQDYQGVYLEYPVLIGIWMWLTSIAIHAAGMANAFTFVQVTWITSLVFAVVAAITMVKLNERRALWFALSPALLLTLTINWDALAVLLTALAFVALKCGNFGWAGIAIGLGASAKLYPALLLVVFLAYIFDDHQISRAKLYNFARLALGFAESWLLVNLPFAVSNFEGWFRFYSFSSERGIDFGSIWLALYYLFDLNISTHFVNVVGLITVIASCIAAFLLRKRVDIYTMALALVAVFVLVNKVYSPQYWLWLTGLLAFSNITLRQYVWWNIAQFGYFVAIWRYLYYLTQTNIGANTAGGLDSSAYSIFIVAQWIATLAIVVISVRRSLQATVPPTTAGTLAA